MSYLLVILTTVRDGVVEMLLNIDSWVFVIFITLSLEAVIILLTSWYLLMRTRPMSSQGHTNLISASVAVTVIVTVLSILYYPIGGGEFDTYTALVGVIVIALTLGWSASTIIGLNRKLREIDEMDS